ncbi:hypothetical protein, partial [Salmonella sp. SAL4450]|uniref:hypothetical protein n=1 Tax=Salmonella sp. SAL4450 TaxID=3159905 RepID=UPI00397D57E5
VGGVDLDEERDGAGLRPGNMRPDEHLVGDHCERPCIHVLDGGNVKRPATSPGRFRLAAQRGGDGYCLFVVVAQNQNQS